MRPDYVISSDVLTQAECEKIIQHCQKNTHVARIGRGRGGLRRRSHVSWITSGSELDDLVVKCFHQLQTIAWEFFDQEIGFIEPVQFTSYGFGNFYNWHVDAGIHTEQDRVISASLELTDPKTYKGGGLKFKEHPNPVPKRAQGTMICFPSLMIHQARPVFWGTRCSLVFWGARKDGRPTDSDNA